MSFSFHDDRSISYNYQVLNTKDSVIPFIENEYTIGVGANVLEIGCGEGGVLRAFVERGCICVGVDFNRTKLDVANDLFKVEIIEKKIKFIDSDIYDVSFKDEYKQFFDIIILKDTIEHIYDHKKVMLAVKEFLKADGIAYFGFPPWYMPFGGHQQVCKSKIASLLPYYHILPNFLYFGIARLFGESADTIQFLRETKDTRITPGVFEEIVASIGMKVVQKKFYLIAPMYQYKFKLKVREQFKFIEAIPVLNNLFSTTCDYIIRKK